MEQRHDQQPAAVLPSGALHHGELTEIQAWWIAGTEDNPAWYLTD